MSTDKKDYEIVFAPGCFDGFDGTQEELDELIAEIHRKFKSGEAFDEAIPLTEEGSQEIAEFLERAETRKLQ